MRTLVKTQCGTPTSNRFFFDDFFGKDFFDANLNSVVKSTPSVNVKEDDKQFIVEVAAPGLQKEDFNIALEKSVLTISAEKESEKNEANENSKFTRKEFSYTSFKRSFTVDEESLDSENIVAKYENGILNISIPKKAKATEDKKIKKITIL